MPRVERVVEPDSIACPCGCGDMVKIGEDRSERLYYIPARYQVFVTVRPRYTWPKGRAGEVQAKAPVHLLDVDCHLELSRHCHRELTHPVVMISVLCSRQFRCFLPFLFRPLGTGLEAVAVIAGLENMAAMSEAIEERSGHFGIAATRQRL
jgi:hypothetical protein